MMRKCLAVAIVLLASAPSAHAATTVASVGELQTAIGNANAGSGDPVILLETGTYTLSVQWGLLLSRTGLTLRGASGDREAVIVEGAGMSNNSVSHCFQITGDDVTIEDMTLRRVGSHAVQIHGEAPHDADGTILRNCIFQDTGQQMVKVSYVEGDGYSADDGLVEGCLFEFTAGIGPQFYIGGIDAHAARDWVVRRNEFHGIRSPDGSVAEHAIHFWSDAQNTLVERNLIVNCDRGIGFGLGSRGHQGGIIRNNMIYHGDLSDRGDIGIELESASDVQVLHNTVLQEHSFPGAISVRFGASTGVEIRNNLVGVNGGSPVWFRDGATASQSGNVTNATTGLFVNPGSGNLHLKTEVALPSILDQADESVSVSDDFDGDVRPQGDAPDVGADELGAASALEDTTWAAVKAKFRS
jgi:hypothetical protein